MNIGDNFYGLVPLILMFLVIFSPFLKKWVKSVSKEKTDRESISGDLSNGIASNQIIQRIQSEEEQEQIIEFIQSEEPFKKRKDFGPEKERENLRRLDNISFLKRSVVWKEILSLPVSLRGPGQDGYL